MQLGIAVTRAAGMDATWTTIHLARAALSRGHAVRFVEPWDWEVDDRGQLVARAWAFEPGEVDGATIVRRLQRRNAARRYQRIDAFDVLLLRAAPFDASLLGFATMAEARGVAVVNRPNALIQTSSKAWLAALPDVPTPPTMVTRSRGNAHLFAERVRKPLIVKPARGSGGRLVSKVSRRDAEGLDRAFGRAAAAGGHVVLQAYLPEAKDGEKRVMWMDGEVLGAYLRTRARGEFRHNLSQGGLAVPCQLSAAELAVVARITPHLIQTGIRLAGIDLIGHHVIEVNCLNPGGAFHIDRLNGSDVGGRIVDKLAASEPGPDPRGRSPWALPAP